MAKRTFDLAQLRNENVMSDNPYKEMPLGYFNALLASVVGTDDQSKLAKEYLKEIDPDIWNE